MECKDVEAVFEQEGLSPLPLEAREHLSDCEACRELLADLSVVVAAAKGIPAEEHPPERVWAALCAQLEAEGIIREPQVLREAEAASGWQALVRLLRPRVLAMVGTGVLAVAGGLYYSNKQVTKSSGPTMASKTPPAMRKPAEPAASETPAVVPPAVPTLRAENTVRKPAGRSGAVPPGPSQIRESQGELRPSPSELASFGESAAVLDQTERFVPNGEVNNAAADAALRENLRTLNEFIAECKARLKENPGDQLTQEYLNMALQQKAELLSAMMDSTRSEH